MKKIWVNGTFDVLHIGHVKLIQHASTLGLVRVGIDTDERVKEKKGNDRPFNTLKNRMDFISALKGVDSVVSFSSDDELIDRIKEWETDIMVIGDDYNYHNIIGVEYVQRIEFFQKIEGISTTKILGHEKRK